jgi:hypothetical protein
MIAIALLAWPWHRQSQALANLRLWPSYTLGIFKGKVYGQDLVVSARLAKTVVPASFLGAAAAAMALSPALFGESQSGDFWRLLPSRLLLAAFGAIILGPILARLATPVNALGWALALLALGIGFGPELASSRAAALAGPESPLWGQAPALAPLGAVWPLAARVQVARSDQVAPAIGRLDLWLVLGAAGGFSAAGLLALEGGSPGFWPSVAAWTGALLAMAPTLGWAAAIMLWILANAAVAYF